MDAWLEDERPGWEQAQASEREHYERSRKMSQPIDPNTSWDALVPSESKYLKKEDVGEDGVILTIRGFKREMLEADGKEEEKTVLYFVEREFRPMVLNITNKELLKMATGAASPAQARGKQIVVFADPSVGFAGKITGGLRIKKVPAPPATTPKDAAFDDDFPF